MLEGVSENLVAQLADALQTKGWKMATAESCTGGWISKICTDLAGSSAWFERGFVTYSNESKMDMLGVGAGTLSESGAVSRETAESMANGALNHAPVQAAVAVTGVAGPDGGSDEKPVGTVWFGWAVENQPVTSEVCRFHGDRDSVRQQTVIHALEGLLAKLKQARNR